MGRPIWYVTAALVALGINRPDDLTQPFTALDLSRWLPCFPTRSTPMRAIKNMVQNGFAEPVIGPRPLGAAQPAGRWRLTPTGVERVSIALISDEQLPPAAYGPMQRAGTVESFAARLWNLLRIRRVITSDDAASLLTDAGDDVAAARKKANALLAAWHQACPLALRVANKRVAGSKRYVLQVDVGPTPPVTVRASKGGPRA